jgi:hypothetical protein
MLPGPDCDRRIEPYGAALPIDRHTRRRVSHYLDPLLCSILLGYKEIIVR